jgi:two-component system nitrate/nitrite response regulator NarL
MGTRVLVVDDHAAFRRLARALLTAEGFDVVGESADAAGALEAATRLSPDLVLLDVRLPDGDGFDVAEALADLPDPAPVVVLCSTREASSYRHRIATTRAAGFIAKRDLSAVALRAFAR